MSDPDRPDTPELRPAPSPFDGAGRPGVTGPEGGGTGPGVGKPLLIGCGALLVLLLVAGVLFVVNESAVFAWLLEEVQGQIEPLVPESLPRPEKERFDRAFERAIAATRAGQADPIALQQALQRLQRGVAAAAEKGEKARLSPEDVAGITKALEAVPRATAEPEGGPRDAAGAGARAAPPG